MFKRVFCLVVVSVFGLLVAASLDAKPAAAAVPAGFGDRLVTPLQDALALTFTPDGRMLITTKSGRLRVYKDGALLQTPALDLSGAICTEGERGLLGVATDPQFGTPGNNYVYVYYTFKKFSGCERNTAQSPVNRVSRFVMNGDTVDRASEDVLIDNIPSPNSNHNGGDLHFGKDGNLYVSVGDGGCQYNSLTRCQNQNGAARDRNILLGKILRITPSGGIPADNPYTGSGSARCNVTGRTVATNCQETFAVGLRNPFRMAFDPDAAGTSFRINDVGGGFWEEIDTGRSGADYGWNVREGHCALGSYTNCGPPPAGMTNPIHDYPHTTGCSSITGGAFVPDDAFPAAYDKAYFFGDYVCNKIFMLVPKPGGGFTRTVFANNLGPGGPVHMAFGPYRGGKALYYTTFDGGGQVRRIDYSAEYPSAALKADPNYGDADPAAPGSTINFDASASKDPQNDPLTYVWDFGDGSTDTTTGATTSHAYATPGKYTVTLTLRDSKGFEDTETITVYPGDTPPEPVIQTPAAGATFFVGQMLMLNGSATDAEDGNLPNTSLSWNVLRHHNGNHTHPWFSGSGNGLSFRGPAPEDLFATNPTGNYLEVRLTATDSLGLSKTTTMRVNPKTVNVRFATSPKGLKLKVNGQAFIAPKTFLSWQGYVLNVYAPAQNHDGRSWVFRSWSDGKPAAHTIVTPSSAKNYTATYRPR